MSHELAITAAKAQMRQYKIIFNSYLGGTKHRNGQLLNLYNATRARLYNLYDLPFGLTRKKQQLDILAFHETQARYIIDRAVEVGAESGTYSAERQHYAYLASTGLALPLYPATFPVDDYSAAPKRALAAQVASARYLIKSGASPRMLLGDKNRVGEFSPWPIAAEIAKWVVLAGSMALIWRIAGPPDGEGRELSPYKRQVVAVVDERTTDCCLRAHGQIKNLDEPFHLTASPRFADYLYSPPFHNYCRTSVALFLPDFDDGLTKKMKMASSRELQERRQREEGKKYAYPQLANALSRFDW